MMLDLCAGFGGQSEAFLQAGWNVLRIDNNPLLTEVPRMIMADVAKLKPFYLGGPSRVDYIHASPPCLMFSTGYDGPRPTAERAGVNWSQAPQLLEAVELVAQCKRVIDDLQPHYWSIENVKGSIKYLAPLLGKPRLIIGHYVFWGNFPLFDFEASTLPTKSSKDKRHHPLRANYSALIPLKLSSAFLAAITDQKTLFDYN